MPDWKDLRRVGLYYEADRSSARYRSEILFVFVHGLGGHPQETWLKLPFLICEHLQVDVDMLSFGYDTGWFKRADIRDAANELGNALRGRRYRFHRHIFFFAHSTGGLIVKRLLASEAPSLSTKTVAAKYLTGDLVAPRTRRIFNFGVPHRGGRPLLTYLQALAMPFCWVLGQTLALANIRNQNRERWGSNLLRLQLAHRNSWVMQLETAYNALITSLDRQRIPRPLSFEIMDPSDVAVNIYAPQEVETVDTHGAMDTGIRVRADFHQIQVRGTHSDIKLPEEIDDPIVDIVCDRLPLDQHIEITIADRTVGRVLRIDGTQVESLVGPQQEDDVANGNLRSQRDADEALAARWDPDSGAAGACSVTGPFGVGKSIVFRHRSLSLATQYLSGTSAKERFPLSIATQHLRLKPDEVGAVKSAATHEDVWRALSQEIARWGNDLMDVELREANWPKELVLAAPKVTDTWVCEVVQTSGVIALLDGIDEFLAAHPSLSATTIIRLINFFESLSDSQRTNLVLFARDEHPATRILRDHTAQITIDPLSERQAKTHFGNALDVMAAIDDAEVRDRYLRPFYLVHFRDHVDSLPADGIKTVNDLARFTVKYVIRKVAREVADKFHADIIVEDWLTCLTCIGWLYYRGLEPELPIDDRPSRHGTIRGIRSRLRELKETWRSFSEGTPRKGPEFAFCQSICPEQMNNDDIFKYVLERTFLVSTGFETYNMHQEWVDSLAALYVTKCVQLEQFHEFAYRGITPNVQRVIAAELGRHTFSARFVRAMSEATLAQSNPFILGNFLALFTYAQVQLGAGGVDALYQPADDFQINLKQLLMSSTGSRALGRYLGNQTNDDTGAEIAVKIIPVLHRIWSDEASNAVTRSMTWCYHKALSAAVDEVEAPEGAWPALSEDDAADGVLLATLEGTPEAFMNQHERSMQLGFMQSAVACTLPGQTYRAIASVHYLYLLTAALSAGKAADEVENQLQKIHAPDSELGQGLQKIFAAFSLVPELLDVFQACTRLAGRTAPQLPANQQPS